MTQYKKRTIYSFFVAHSIFFIANQAPVIGQIVPDSSLGNESSIIQTNNQLTNITGGAQRGKQLFHSFTDFNVPASSQVRFQPNNSVLNILSRVTGNQASQINGLLGVEGGANLFFLNTNGIIFGQNSALDLNGSFLATTANHFKFGNKFEFGSNSGDGVPNVQFNNPTYLSFTAHSKSLQVNGRSISLAQPPNNLLPAINLEPFPVGLAVKPQRTLALVGRGVTLNSGTLTTDASIAHLASVDSGDVKINNITPNQFSLDFNKVKQFEDLLLDNESLINASSLLAGGQIQLDGKNIDIQNFSLLFINNQGFGDSGSINVIAREDFSIIAENTLNKSVPPGFLRRFGGILTQTFIGQGANVNINAQNFNLSNNSTVYTSTFGSGNAGNITIQADNNVNFTDRPGFINRGPANNVAISITVGSGSSGQISVDAKDIVLGNGSIFSSVTAGLGKGGDILIENAELIEVKGFNPNSLLAANISAASIGPGDGGKVIIDTDQLTLLDGGRIDTSTLAAGNAGDIEVEAKNIEISGRVPNSLSSQITSSGQKVDATQAQLFGISLDLTGDSGSVKVEADDIFISDQAQISVNNFGSGNAGELLLDANTLRLYDNALITAATEGGNGGNINLASKFLALSNSEIESSAKGFGTGGNIDISTDLLSLFDSSVIQANAENNQAGRVNIDAKGLLLAKDSNIVATSSLGPQFDGTVEIDQTTTDLTFPDTPFIDNRPSELSKSACQSDEGSSLAQHGKGGYFNSVEERRRYAKGLQQRLAIANQYSYKDAEGNIVPFQRWMGVQRRDRDAELEFVFSSKQNKLLHALLTSNENQCS